MLQQLGPTSAENLARFLKSILNMTTNYNILSHASNYEKQVQNMEYRQVFQHWTGINMASRRALSQF